MNADKLSTGGASPVCGVKEKGRGKEKIPLDPYREKGKIENLWGAGFDMMTFLAGCGVGGYVRKAEAGVASCPLEEEVGSSISTGETPVVAVVGT